MCASLRHGGCNRDLAGLQWVARGWAAVQENTMNEMRQVGVSWQIPASHGIMYRRQPREHHCTAP